MNDRLERLAARRAELVARAEMQRAQLSRSAAPLRKSLSLADRGLAAFRYVTARPLLMAAGAAALAVMSPRLLLKWAQRGWLAWRLLRGIPGKLP